MITRTKEQAARYMRENILASLKAFDDGDFERCYDKLNRATKWAQIALTDHGAKKMREIEFSVWLWDSMDNSDRQDLMEICGKSYEAVAA